MNDPDPRNRRVHTRVEQKGYIRVVVEAAPDAPNLEGKVFQCTTRDLSAGGLLMVVHTPVPVGTMVRLHVVFTDPRAEFEHVARVAWSRLQSDDIIQDYAIGIEFTRTEGQQSHAWSEMLNARILGSGAAPR